MEQDAKPTTTNTNTNQAAAVLTVIDDEFVFILVTVDLF